MNRNLGYTTLWQVQRCPNQYGYRYSCAVRLGFLAIAVLIRAFQVLRSKLRVLESAFRVLELEGEGWGSKFQLS
jgi:hypothetical protein